MSEESDLNRWCQSCIDQLWADTLLPQWCLLLRGDDAFPSYPLLWVDPGLRQDVLELGRRCLALGAPRAQLSGQERFAAYGAIETRWLYYWSGQQALAFFLSVAYDVPAFSHAQLDLKAQQGHFFLVFDVAQKTTLSLLQAMVKYEGLLLHFFAVPGWITQQPPPGGHPEARRQEITQHIRSSFPVAFTAAAVADLQAHLDQLLVPGDRDRRNAVCR
jgi:hypothetical protein